MTSVEKLTQALDWAREALERMRAEVAVTRAALAAVREVVAGLDAAECGDDAAALARDVLAVLPPEDTTPDLDFRRTVPPVEKATDLGHGLVVTHKEKES